MSIAQVDLIKLSALTDSIDASLAAATEALSSVDVDPDYISYTIGVLPDSTGAVSGTIGSYFTVDGLLQKLEWNGTSWVNIGQQISSKEYVDDKASLLDPKEYKNETVVCFIDDDARSEAYSILKPIFDNKSVPNSISVPVKAIWPEETGDPTFDNSNYLTATQLDELVNTDGWELVSHQIDFKSLTDDGLTEAEVIDEIKGSKEIFEDKGYSPKVLAYHRGDNNTFTRSETKKHYRAGLGVNYQLAPNSYPLYTFEIRRYRMDGNPLSDGEPTSYAYFKDIVDQHIAQPGLLIFMTHASDAPAKEEIHADKDGNLTDVYTIMGQIIDYIQANNIDILTISDALDRVGNVVDTGDQGGNFSDSLAIGVNGKIRGLNMTFRDVNLGRDAGKGAAGTRRTAIGDSAGKGNTADHQTAVGSEAGTSNSGLESTQIGSFAGQDNSGEYQTVVGRLSGWKNSGSHQTAIGYRAGYRNNQASQTVVGYFAGLDNVGLQHTAVGYQAGEKNEGNDSVQMGYRAGYNNVGADQTAVGFRAGYENNQARQTVFGAYAGEANTGDQHTAVGRQAGFNNSGADSVQVGYRAGYQNAGANQTAVGSLAGMSNSGNNQTAAGFFAGHSNTGNDAVMLGRWAGRDNIADNIVAVGFNAGYKNQGGNSSLVGNGAGRDNTGGSLIALGYLSGNGNSGATVVGIGNLAGNGNSGDNLVAIGGQAGRNNSTPNRFVVEQRGLNSNVLLEGDFEHGGLAIGAPGTANKLADTRIGANRMTFYLDEATDKLHFRVKYADGTTIKEGEVALV